MMFTYLRAPATFQHARSTLNWGMQKRQIGNARARADPETSFREIVDFGDYVRTYRPVGLHPPRDWQSNIWFAKSLHEAICIASHERLAVRVRVWGSCSDLAGADILLEFLHTMNTDEFLVSIPVRARAYEGRKENTVP